MSAEEFKEHQFQLHAKAREAEKLAGSMNQMLEPLEHAERKQYREFRANQANLMQSLNESRAQLREVRNQTLANAQADEALMKSSEAAVEATANREELEAAREHNAAVELAREKYEVQASRVKIAQQELDKLKQQQAAASKKLTKAKLSLSTEQHVARRMNELADKTPEELARILQDEILHTRESQNLHDVAVLRFNATLQASSELSTVTQKEIVQTNQSLREALTEAAKLNETCTELRNQLEAKRPVDCVLTKWSEWTECDAKCDSGNQHRSRQMIQAAKNGGDCPSERTQRQLCVVAQCPFCGDGILNSEEEQCDSVEGCTSECTIETGWSCAGNNCGKCGNGKLEAAEECDDGDMASGDGCGPKCQIEEAFACVQQLDRSKCTPIDEFAQIIQQGIVAGQRSCKETEVFIPTDFTDGTGQCAAVPEDRAHKIYSTTIVSGGDALSSAASGNGELAVVKSVQIPGLIAAPGLERSGSHHAKCRTTAAGVCARGSQHSRQCVRYATSECLELVMDERFCDAHREVPGEVQMRARNDQGLLHRATPVCVFAKCQLPEAWLTTEGVMAGGVEWCADAVLQGI